VTTLADRDEHRLDRPAREEPQRPWAVPLSDIVVDDEIASAVAEALRSGWWSMGPRVAELERQFAGFCGARAAVAVANGTAALHLSLLAAGCGPGDEVLVPSLNFVAAANTIRHVGATPVFCDIEGPTSLNVDPGDIEAAIGPATRALVVMHYGGVPCRMDAILEIAARHDLALIEDAAHAPGATWRGRACGTFGDLGCFSFFSNKNLPTGEGGIVVTDDDSLAEKLRLLRSHGMTTLTWDRHRGQAHDYDVVEEGFNYRFDELRAAIALVQLPRLRRSNAARGRISARYRAELAGVRGIRMPFAPDADTIPAHHLAVILLPPNRSREEFRAALAASGIQTSVHYPPIHLFSRYRELGAKRSLPRTEEVAEQLVTLPLYPHMSEADVDAVVGAVRAAA
jgi:dTDP-4-amino-4,6-dideoxygalactose transaminase